jgi:hypothetical protein
MYTRSLGIDPRTNINLVEEIGTFGRDKGFSNNRKGATAAGREYVESAKGMKGASLASEQRGVVIGPQYVSDELDQFYKSLSTHPDDVVKAKSSGDTLLLHNFPSTGAPNTPGVISPTVAEDIKSKFIKRTERYSKNRDMITAPPDPISAGVDMAILDGIRKGQKAEITDIIYLDGKPMTYAEAGKNANLSKRIRDLIGKTLSKDATTSGSGGVGWGVGAGLGSLFRGQVFTPSQMALMLTSLTTPEIASKLGISMGKMSKSGTTKLDKIRSSKIPSASRVVTREGKEDPDAKRYPFGQPVEEKKYPFPVN